MRKAAELRVLEVCKMVDSNVFRKMSDSDLANYYVDVCLYREIRAVEEQKKIRKIMVERFVEKFADKPIEHNLER